jgi:predicted TIM-barrel fold metal-dependent hydrolase
MMSKGAIDQPPLCQKPDLNPHGPTRFQMPAGAVDCHAHVIGAPPDYPWVENRNYTPSFGAPADYLEMLNHTGAAHGVLVQVSVHGTDNRVMLETLRSTQGRLRGIAVFDVDVGDATLAEMNAAGVVGLRLNMMFAGGVGLENLRALAARIAPMGWHLQLWLDIRKLPEIEPLLRGLPVPVVIDHMGHFPPSVGLMSPGFQSLLRLMQTADLWVKLSGAYRLSEQGPPYADTIALAQALVKARPDRYVWGSDWPHVALAGHMPNVGDLLDLLADWIPDADQREAVLVHNARALYGFKQQMRLPRERL